METYFDPSVRFDELAVAIANIVTDHLFPCRFGAAPLNDWPMLDGVRAIFSNCGYSEDERGPLVVKAIRDRLAEEGVEELGFGISADGGYSWVIIVESTEGEYWVERAGEAWHAVSASMPKAA